MESNERAGDFDANLLEEQDTIEDLARALDLQQGFGLYFLCIRQAEQRAEIIKELNLLYPARIKEIFLKKPIDHLFQYLQQTLPDLVHDTTSLPILCIYGIENWLGGIEGVQNSVLIGDLNATRNLFSDFFNHPVVFLVPEHVLVGIMRGAPDFFSIRSGVYFLDTPPTHRFLPSAESIVSANTRMLLGVDMEQRRRFRIEWEELLNGYRALPPENRDHLAEATLLHNLGELYQVEANLDQSLVFLHNALTAYKRVLGDEHLLVTECLTSLGSTYEGKGDTVQALLLLQEALLIREKFSYGNDNLLVAASATNLAMAHIEVGDYAHALPLLQRALKIFEATLGPDHPDTATVIHNLGRIYSGQGDYNRALPLIERALSIRSLFLGPNHPEVEKSFSALSYLFMEKGDYARALPLLQRALEISQAAFGPDHPGMAINLNNLGKIYFKTGDTDQAKSVFERAVQLLTKHYGSDHRITQLITNNLNDMLEIQEQKDDASHSERSGATIFEDFIPVKRRMKETIPVLKSESDSICNSLEEYVVNVRTRYPGMTGDQMEWRDWAIKAMYKLTGEFYSALVEMSLPASQQELLQNAFSNILESPDSEYLGNVLSQEDKILFLAALDKVKFTNGYVADQKTWLGLIRCRTRSFVN